MKPTLSLKMLGGSLVSIALVLALSGLGLWTVDSLRVLQDGGADSAYDAIDAAKGMGIGPELYEIVADAEINRDLAATEKSWSAAKTEVDRQLTELTQASDSDQERSEVAAARESYAGIVQLFETKMLPLLRQTDGITPEIRAADGAIDASVAALSKVMKAFQESNAAQAHDSDVVFDTTGRRSSVMLMVVAGIAVLLALAVAIGLARAILRPVRGMTAVMARLAEGDKSVAVPASAGATRSATWPRRSASSSRA